MGHDAFLFDGGTLSSTLFERAEHLSLYVHPLCFG
jgi:hypothetical protein